MLLTLVQTIHIGRPRTSQRRSHIRLPASPSPPTAGPSESNDPPAPIPQALPPFSEPTMTAEHIAAPQTMAPIYRLLDKPTRAKILSAAKYDLRRQMFTIVAVPDTLKVRNEMIKQATRAARQEVLGINCTSDSIRTLQCSG